MTNGRMTDQAPTRRTMPKRIRSPRHDGDLWPLVPPRAHLENPFGTTQAGFPDGRFADSQKPAKISDQESLDIPRIHRVVINAKCSYYYIVKQTAPMINWRQDEGPWENSKRYGLFPKKVSAGWSPDGCGSDRPVHFCGAGTRLHGMPDREAGGQVSDWPRRRSLVTR